MFLRRFWNYWIVRPTRTNLILFCSILLTTVTTQIDVDKYGPYTFTILAAALGLVIITLLVQLIRKEWSKALWVFSVLFVNICIACCCSIWLVLNFQSTPDHYADHLKIPANLQLAVPVNQAFADSLINISRTTPDLLLFNGGLQQPGMYQFAFLYPKVRKGTIYLKAFEITHNDRLTEEELRIKTETEVENYTDSVKMFNKPGIFSIYEGDFGKPYAARFEVWYRKEGNGNEQKIFEKNFKIEGWMR